MQTASKTQRPEPKRGFWNSDGTEMSHEQVKTRLFFAQLQHNRRIERTDL